jgi:hypothetical protein
LGTNSREFSLLSGLQDGSKYNYQLQAYWSLKALQSERVGIVARLGTGHHRRTIHFVFPDSGESMFLRRNWSPEFEAVYNDVATKSPMGKIVAETINAEGDGGINNYVHRAIPGIARCLDAGIITSRTASKAIEKASLKYGVKIPIFKGDLAKLNEDYLDFLRYFEPMGRDPAHVYCGESEFKVEARKNCDSKCPYSLR